MKRIALPLFTLLAGGCAHAQQAAKLEFEVASVRPSSPQGGTGKMIAAGCRGGPGSSDPTLFTCLGTNLSNLLLRAYPTLAFYQLSAPDWMQPGGPRFDIRATVPEGTTKEQFTIMLQNLLADRFRLVAHHDTREIQRYELTVGKNGPKFKEHVGTKKDSVPADAAAGPIKLDKDGYPLLVGPMAMAMMGGKARMHWPEMTMDMLATTVAGQLRGPVANATGLTGKYDISLYWSYETAPAGPPGAGAVSLASDPGPTIVQALQDQLGLRVESKKGPVDFLVVDHAEKLPTEN
jgi:uncharacterized protein (TIGR03435 family)